MTKSEWTKPANAFTFLRLILVILLYYLAIKQATTIFVAFFVIAGITDALDGFVARKLKQASKRGALFDSITDHVFYLSSIFWLIWLRPEALQQRTSIIILFLLLFFYVVAKLVVTRKMEFIHLWPSKFAGAALYIFILVSVLIAFYPLALNVYIIILAFALIYEARTWRRT